MCIRDRCWVCLVLVVDLTDKLRTHRLSDVLVPSDMLAPPFVAWAYRLGGRSERRVALALSYKHIIDVIDLPQGNSGARLQAEVTNELLKQGWKNLRQRSVWPANEPEGEKRLRSVWIAPQSDSQHEANHNLAERMSLQH